MSRSKNPKKTWRYSEEFKVRAVRMSYQEGVQVQQVAEGLGIHPFMLSRWRKEYREGRIKGGGGKRMGVKKEGESRSAQELSELARLKREIVRLRRENDILKKWQRYLAERHQSALDSSRSTDES